MCTCAPDVRSFRFTEGTQEKTDASVAWALPPMRHAVHGTRYRVHSARASIRDGVKGHEYNRRADLKKHLRSRTYSTQPFVIVTKQIFVLYLFHDHVPDEDEEQGSQCVVGEESPQDSVVYDERVVARLVSTVHHGHDEHRDKQYDEFQRPTYRDELRKRRRILVVDERSSEIVFGKDLLHAVHDDPERQDAVRFQRVHHADGLPIQEQGAQQSIQYGERSGFDHGAW